MHHIAWQVGDAVFSGDVAGVRINKEVVMPPCPPPDINVEDWVNSINTLRKINPSKIYLTHFGEITDIKAHLDSLEKRLHAWANWIKPHWEAGKKPQEVTPAFQAYVKQDLLHHGVSEAGVEQYEAANPSWMSVAGLVRYWTKKREGKL